MNNVLEQFKKYTEHTYSGKKLLEQNSLDDVGIWKIKGEDPNCDFGGSHHQPDLGIVEGKLRDVIMYGVMLPGFWQWGHGGDFQLIGNKIPKIDVNSWVVREELLNEQERLEKELKAVKDKLKVMQ